MAFGMMGTRVRPCRGRAMRKGPCTAGRGTRFVFLPNARNVRRRVPSPPIQEIVPDEPAPRTPANWKQSPEALFKYVDDHIQVLKVNTETVQVVNGVKDKHTMISENTFEYSSKPSRGVWS